jgi:UDPglucose--hexose-1-phosphate uridylyltransferase
VAEPGPHRRRNLLTGEWVLVSPQRTARPWQGQVEAVEAESRPAHDPDCYLCPGNKRAGGARTPEYRATHVFDNDFPALLPGVAEVATGDPTGLLVAEAERGICRVVCYSPRHDLTLGEMDLDAVVGVVETWTEQYRELGAIDWVANVLVFENRGSMMGASNPHPHGQIWADETLPNEVAEELDQQRAHHDADGTCLLCRYVELELQLGERVVVENDAFVAVVPHWAVWPFETLVLAKAHHGALPDLSTDEQRGLADLLRRLARRYDGLFDVTFPYSMGLHQRPTDGDPHPEWHLHAHVYPPLLRSATIRKFMVGYELLAQPQRDLTPEAAAARLVEVGER